jgi:hypothetical protein
MFHVLFRVNVCSCMSSLRTLIEVTGKLQSPESFSLICDPFNKIGGNFIRFLMGRFIHLSWSAAEVMTSFHSQKCPDLTIFERVRYT